MSAKDTTLKFTWQFAILVWLISVKRIYATNYCCSFDGNECQWSNSGAVPLKWSGEPNNTPDIDSYSDFTDGASGEYVWVQSPPDVGEFTYSSTSMQVNDQDVVTIGLYRSADADASTILTVQFTEEGQTPVHLADISATGWTFNTLTCGDGTTSTVICCSSALNSCNGVFSVTGTVVDSLPALLAMTNFSLNGCPPPDFCNQLESATVDGWDLGKWTLASTTSPPNDLQHASDYAWTHDTQAEKIISPPVLFQDTVDEVKFQYYLSTTDPDIENALIVYAYDLDSNTRFPKASYGDSGTKWIDASFKCDKTNLCCEYYPCSGYVAWESSYAVGDVLVAIDSLQLNEGCENAVSCCKFEEDNLCGYTNNPDTSDSIWQWSSTASTLIPQIDGYFAWWQNEEATNTKVTATYKSNKFTMQQTSNISFSYYANIGQISQSTLDVYFRMTPDGSAVPMESIRYSSENVWIDWTVQCNDPSSRCCQLPKGCTGWLEFSVTSTHSGDQFAIDNVQVDNQCNA